MHEIMTAEELAALVEEMGFLPFFRNGIAGLSVEEHTPAAYWFGDEPGPWEWKGPVIRQLGCAYGRFFGGRAGFISRAWFADFANWRRDGYDFDARYDEGLAKTADKFVFDILDGHDRLPAQELKRLGGFGKQGKKGFESIITRLQMQGYITTADFVYPLNRQGQPYGWGLACYATPEHFFGAAFTEAVYRREPQESRARMLQHLSQKLPHVPQSKLLQLIG